MKFFNTAGPIITKDHYHIPTENRLDLNEVMMLIEQKKYFLLHAPRQSGKTSTLFHIMKTLNSSGKYKCLYVNVESAQIARGNAKETNHSILESLERAESIYLKEDIISKNFDNSYKRSSLNALANILSKWSVESTLPTVLLIDEIDSLVGDGLISVLRQLRSGYTDRPHAFPQSIILCGVRDIRDYRMYSDKEKEIITGGSCFNIKSKSLTLKNFTLDDVENLYLQHTNETNQKFSDEAIKKVFKLTDGQPWLVNALAYVACFELLEGKNRKNQITKDLIDIAKESLIKQRVTHLDQLADKLKEDRIKSLMEPMLAGEDLDELNQNDVSYAIDLGLVKKTQKGLQISNDIYKEIIPRELSYMTQTRMEPKVNNLWFIKESGELDIEKLLSYFQQFFRENSQSYLERFSYKEAGPQLLLQAYLQRVINGGGRIYREYGLGRKRTDLLVEWKNSKFVLELKIKHDANLEKTIKKSLEQTFTYMDMTGCDIGHLLIFDRDDKKNWDEKIFRQERTFCGKKIIIWGM